MTYLHLNLKGGGGAGLVWNPEDGARKKVDGPGLGLELRPLNGLGKLLNDELKVAPLKPR